MKKTFFIKINVFLEYEYKYQIVDITVIDNNNNIFDINVRSIDFTQFRVFFFFLKKKSSMGMKSNILCIEATSNWPLWL